MSFTLHQALVPTWIQMLGALDGLVDKAAAHCAEKGAAEEDVACLKLAPDMLDFAFQVKSARVHSVGALEGVRAGTFSPDRSEAPRSFEGMKVLLGDARATLEALDPAELDTYLGKPMEFRFGDFVLPYLAEDFLLSFSQPNFFFHVTTAFGLLRKEGVAIGKRDYLGGMGRTAE